MGTFAIKTVTNGQFYFSLKADNGQKILASEGYTTKAACNNGIDSVKSNAKDDGKYDCKTSSNGKHYFNLKATNGQFIGTSEMYEAASGRDNGIESVKKNAPAATVAEEYNIADSHLYKRWFNFESSLFYCNIRNWSCKSDCILYAGLRCIFVIAIRCC